MGKLPVELQPDERLILRVRRTPVYLWAKLAGYALLAVAPVVAELWILSATAGLDGAAGGVAIVAAVIWVAVWLVRAYFTWYRHHHDEWIVTDQRLIDSQKRSPFNQSVASADLVNVQDIAVRKQGLLPSMFDFGDVVCQTAGTDARFVLSDVPHPAEVMRTIDAERDAARAAPYAAMRDRIAPGGPDAGGGPSFVPRAAPPDHIDGPPAPGR